MQRPKSRYALDTTAGRKNLARSTENCSCVGHNKHNNAFFLRVTASGAFACSLSHKRCTLLARNVIQCKTEEAVAILMAIAGCRISNVFRQFFFLRGGLRDFEGLGTNSPVDLTSPEFLIILLIETVYVRPQEC